MSGALVLASMVFSPGALGAAPAKLVLVSIDGLTPGMEQPASRMPALASLTSSGAQCARACSPASVAFPAWAELLTGCGPERTLVRDEFTRGLGEGTPTLAATLGALGYRTLGLPADPLAHSASGLARGFERYSPTSPAMSDSARVDSAIAWLRAPGRRFTWVALSMGPPSDSWRRSDGVGPREPLARAAKARELDRALGRLVAGLSRAGLSGRALIVVSGTASVPGGPAQVPVVFRGPAESAASGGRSISVAASLADVAPTLVAAAGGVTAGFDGIDLLASPRPIARSERVPCPPADVERGIDAMALPAECAAEFRTRLASPEADSVAFAGWDSLVARCPGSARLALERDVALSRAGREVPAARGLKAAVAALPADPRPLIAYADHLLRHDRLDLLPEVLQRIPPDNPYAALAQWRLALAYAGQQDFLAAQGAADRAALLAVPTRAALGLSAAYHALSALEDSASRAPRDAELRMRYGRALGDFGLYKAAYLQFHAAQGVVPASPEPDFWLATYLDRQGRPQHAVPTLIRSLEHDSTYVPSRLALADALMELGRRPEARAQLERLQGSLGSDSRLLYNLACLRATDGEIPGALEALERAMAAGYADSAGMAADHDLDTLRSEPRFRALLERRGR